MCRYGVRSIWRPSSVRRPTTRLCEKGRYCARSPAVRANTFSLKMTATPDGSSLRSVTCQLAMKIVKARSGNPLSRATSPCAPRLPGGHGERVRCAVGDASGVVVRKQLDPIWSVFARETQPIQFATEGRPRANVHVELARREHQSACLVCRVLFDQSHTEQQCVDAP